MKYMKQNNKKKLLVKNLAKEDALTLIAEFVKDVKRSLQNQRIGQKFLMQQRKL